MFSMGSNEPLGRPYVRNDGKKFYSTDTRDAQQKKKSNGHFVAEASSSVEAALLRRD